MVIDAWRPVAIDRKVHRTSRWTSSSPVAKACGMNSVISILPAFVVLAGREGVRDELRDLDTAGQVGEEARDARGTGTRSVPRGGVGGRLGRPVDVVGDAVQDGRDVTAPDRVVDLPDQLEVVFLAHCRAPLLDAWRPR